jgi:hypothetical protein
MIPDVGTPARRVRRDREGHCGGVLSWSSVRWSMTQAKRAVSGTSSTAFELVDNGEGRVLEDVAA